MKKISGIVFLLGILCLKQPVFAQQTFIGFDSTFAVLLPDSARQNDTASFRVRIKNLGSFPTDSSLQIFSGVASSGLITNIAAEQTIPSLSNLFLAANDTVSTRAVINYSANRFNLGIDVVVIWPKANNAVTTDSLYYSVFVYPNTTAIANLLQDYGFTVFPNPFSSILSIHTENTVERINIYDTQGRFVLSRSKAQTIDLSELGTATYYLELVYKSGSRKRIKVMKQSVDNNH